MKIDYKTYKKPSDFIEFAQGETKIRIISDGLLARFHGSRMRGKYIPLGLCTENGDCSLCKQGNEPKRVWRWIAYDYANKELKLLNAGAQLGNIICLELGGRFGDPQEYDIVVIRKGEKKNTEYTAMRAEKSVPLKPETLLRFQPMKNFLMKKYFEVVSDEKNR